MRRLRSSRAFSFSRAPRRSGKYTLHSDTHAPLIADGDCMIEDETISRIEAQLAEQAQLIGLLNDFLSELSAGADTDQMLTSAAFRQTLRRLAQTQRDQQALLNADHAPQIKAKFPELLEQGRTLLELLGKVTSGERGHPQEAAAFPSLGTA
mmetsp:Transcript_38184/g.89367  ORF Transcript_38184/g.89367 Transcript_38184/m.89367 type:complete len:152 (-) Transcript_38184:220-675(-)|eukprot:CAMPEP_0119377146 /NCGR_PEP_ID=MMETSP1334-20130426/43444_1 /TAXON_ID=127549 /ORGANISM="Calcidiscus leptoporus, Strain RCC1130" /LENGTH=151 /DNA_ID=CAMNT_0007395957 /DNA_START=30 /DNA_END=485 /DNA_ORIENTATION=-